MTPSPCRMHGEGAAATAPPRQFSWRAGFSHQLDFLYQLKWFQNSQLTLTLFIGTHNTHGTHTVRMFKRS